MNVGQTLFAQVMEYVPWKTFDRIIERYKGDAGVRTLDCADLFRVMAFAQLTWRESLRDIEICLKANRAKLFHMGIRNAPARATLADALNLRGAIPAFIHISDGKMADVRVLDMLSFEAGAFYVMDRGYLDFARLYKLHQASAFFVTRAKRGMNARRVYSAETDRSTGVLCDQSIALNGVLVSKKYPVHLRPIRYNDAKTGKTLVFLTTSENGVKAQIWCAVSTYVLIAIVKKELHLDASLYTFLQILPVSIFEKTQLSCAFAADEPAIEPTNPAKQLNLFEI